MSTLTISPGIGLAMHPTLDAGLAKFEKALNVPGYIPVISTLSGGFRILTGKIEIIAAIVLGAFFILKGALSSDAYIRSRQIDYGIGVIKNYTIHGVANIARGLIEAIPVANLGCLAYDLTGRRLRYAFERV